MSSTITDRVTGGSPIASTDRITGLSQTAAVKVACRVATTANITLSGLQTIDGVTLVADDRVLVKNQSDTTQNGIYIASTGTWRRAADADDSRDLTNGTRVFVTGGTVGGQRDYFFTFSTDPVVIGTTTVTVTQVTTTAVLADGDKGDITVSGSGATFTIDNNAVITAKINDAAVTYAKLQDASAGNVVLARAAATSGDFAEVALAVSQLLGRGSTGDIAAISLGTGLSMSGATLSAASVFDYQEFTSTGAGTWTKPSGLTGNELVFVMAWGGGGGGGGQGGGGGACVFGFYRANQLNATEAVSVGAGGTAGAANTTAGGVGGNTTFKGITAYGGGGGNASTASATRGGGGGGWLSAGALSGDGGRPLVSTTSGVDGNFGGGNSGGGGINGGASVFGGGGGGGSAASNATDGGSSVFGGGGGAGGRETRVPGTSIFGGNGGTPTPNLSTPAADGATPGGGGGGGGGSSWNQTGGAGARGEVRVWVIG